MAHGLTKEAAIPVADMERALACRSSFATDPAGHTYEEEVGEA